MSGSSRFGTWLRAPFSGDARERQRMQRAYDAGEDAHRLVQSEIRVSILSDRPVSKSEFAQLLSRRYPFYSITDPTYLWKAPAPEGPDA